VRTAGYRFANTGNSLKGASYDAVVHTGGDASDSGLKQRMPFLGLRYTLTVHIDNIRPN